MRRTVLRGLGIGASAILVIGLLVLASQHGVFEGRGSQLLAQARSAQERGDLTAAQAYAEELITTYPQSPNVDTALLALAEIHQAQGDLVETQRVYRTLLAQFPDSPLVDQTQRALGEVNVALLLSPTVREGDDAYEVVPGDTLGAIASRYGTTIEFLKWANGIDSHIIRPGQVLKVSTSRFGIVVDKSENQLLLTEDDEFVKAYPVATGKKDRTPVGSFTIVNRIRDPIWYTQGAVVPPDSPKNILGTRWMGLDKKGYGIHGSVDPTTIGQHITAGCVRMTNADVEELFAIVPVGTEVTIVD